MNDRLLNVWEERSLRAYLGEVKRRHGVVDTLALPNMRDLPPVRIERLFVQPLLSLTQVHPSIDPSDWPAGETLIAAMQASRRIVVLGDPGSGKTTLSNWLAWRMSSGLSATLPEVLENRLPLPCVLREMPPSIFTEGASIVDLSMAIVDRLLGESADEQLKSSLQDIVARKQYVLILDGIDEVPNQFRDCISDWIRQATEDGAGLLATSRIIGYNEFPVHKPRGDNVEFEIQNVLVKETWLSHLNASPENGALTILPAQEKYRFAVDHIIPHKDISIWHDFINGEEWAKVHYIMPFDQGRIESFVGNWYLQRSGSDQEARQRSDDLMFALSQSDVTLELARTPNLLSLMAIVHRERAHLPDGKALLYKEIANAYINTIDQYRKIAAGDALAPYGWETRERWIAYVGFQMQLERSMKSNEDNQSGVIVNVEDVLAWLERAMSVSGASQTGLTSQEFLKWVARRSGLLLPRGDEKFAFVHLSFQEYFCARFIASSVVTPAFVRSRSTADAQISPQSLQAWSELSSWRESLVYLFELISAERDSDWADDLADVVFSGESAESSFKRNRVALAMKILCNRHIILPPERRMQLALKSVDVAIDQWRSPPEFFDDGALQGFSKLGLAKFYSDTPGERKFVSFPAQDKPKQGFGDQNLLLLGIENLEANYNLDDCSQLRLLEINFSTIDSIDFVEEMKFLKHFSGRGLQILDYGVLKNARDLQHLDLAFSSFSKLAQIENLKNINTLYVHASKVVSIAKISKFRLLNRLNVSKTKIKKIDALKYCSELRHLDLSDTKVADIHALSELKKLMILHLRNTSIEDLSPVADITRLIWLDLSGISAVDFSPINKLNQLQVLKLARTKIESLEFIGNCEILEDLDFSNTGIRDLSVLRKLPNISRLRLDGCAIEDWSPLFDLRYLNHLSVRDAGFPTNSALLARSNLKIIV